MYIGPEYIKAFIKDPQENLLGVWDYLLNQPLPIVGDVIRIGSRRWIIAEREWETTGTVVFHVTYPSGY